MQNNKWLVFVGVGIEAVVIVLVSVWLGQWIDNLLRFESILVTILPLIGLAGWVYHVIYMAKNVSKD